MEYKGWSTIDSDEQQIRTISCEMKRNIKPFLPPLPLKGNINREKLIGKIGKENKKDINHGEGKKTKEQLYSAREAWQFKFEKKNIKIGKDKFLDFFKELRSQGINYSLKKIDLMNKEAKKHKNCNLLLTLLRK